ncbi:MAG: conjugal transfer protein [Alphaproteobacteria bacterium]|nr:conjugal transfer protein [Alphaproteobacteria bacterium]
MLTLFAHCIVKLTVLLRNTLIPTRLPALKILLLVCNSAFGSCVGRILNPVTDICWKCLFPITIGGNTVQLGGGEDTPNPRKILHYCKAGNGRLAPGPCVPIGFFEPIRLIDVTRTPYCLVNLGGMRLMRGRTNQGGYTTKKGKHTQTKHSFYHVHWYVYPVIYWLEVLTDFICLEQQNFDLAWMSELDPTWNDDETAFITNPEAILFANPIAQVACAADCAASTAGLPMDKLFWCAGCQGSLYPYNGNVEGHTGGVSSSLLIAERFTAKLHRLLILQGTSGKKALCGRYRMPIIKKSQYKYQMTYPVSEKFCHPFGRMETLLATGKEFPYKGEDYGYLVWRKINCCVGPL